MIPLGSDLRAPVFPFITYGLIAANVLVFIQEISVAKPDAFINAYAAIPYDITHGVVLASPSPPIPALTLVTSMFVHAGLAHIFFNMLFLLVFGPDVEYACGHVGYLVYYFVCGIIGGLTQVFIDPGSHVPAIGASGAIAGVLGGYILTYPTSSIRTIVPIGCFPLFLRVPAVLLIGLWAGSQFLSGWGTISQRALHSQTGGTAYFAHIGGFASGAILIGLFRRRTTPRRYRHYY
ncbi:MAG: rhomboid family intramembrane serine protease [Candidatus Eremiobacteraeota bacterium]|nr:rhomboid family intramembrane serine protease [Candidatus Eremiobacteraeota bacterium]